MGNTVTYLNAPYTVTVSPLRWHKLSLQQTATGYGSKLATKYMLRVPGTPHPYRVYAICWSNTASFYILRAGGRVFLRDCELETAIEKARTK